MGNYIEVNDTLQITHEQGFPKGILELEAHREIPVTLDQLKDKVFDFFGKPRARVYHLEPVRVFLVENIAGKWLFWGHIQVFEQTIYRAPPVNGEPAWMTSGKYRFSQIYDPGYQALVTVRESPPGRSYLKESE